MLLPCQWWTGRAPPGPREDSVTETDARFVSLPVGVVVQRRPGVTRWVPWSWTVTALLPAAPDAHWRVLREDGDVTEYHAGTTPLTLWRTDAEAYRIALAEAAPCAFAILASSDGDWPYEVKLVTANPHEAMQYAEGGDELVEKIPMPPGMIAWVQDWVDRHFVEEKFVKRKRKKHFEDRVDDGIGDARIVQMADVYRTPSSKKARKQ